MKLSQILFLAVSVIGVSSSKCYDKCARKQAAKEKTDHCMYVIRNFNPKTRTSCANPENRYEDLYKNHNVTTLEQQYSEYRPCMDWISGMFFENMVYICILLWLICFVKFPWP